MELLNSFISSASVFVWGVPMLVLLVGTGLYLTIKLRGLQFWALGHAFKLIFLKEENAKGDITFISSSKYKPWHIDHILITKNLLKYKPEIHQIWHSGDSKNPEDWRKKTPPDHTALYLKLKLNVK